MGDARNRVAAVRRRLYIIGPQWTRAEGDFARISDGEQERRIGLPGRSEFHKLTNVETLRRLRNYGPDVEVPPADLEVDTDSSDASRSAASIAEHFGLIPQAPSARYPAEQTNALPGS